MGWNFPHKLLSANRANTSAIDGEPPAAAKKFYDYIHGNTFLLDKLNYAVLALGDTAYPLFCKAFTSSGDFLINSSSM